MSMNALAVDAAVIRSVIPQPPSKDDVLAGLTKYIPTESVTLYVATVSSLMALKDTGLTIAVAYWFFVCFTPLLMLLLFLRQIALTGKDWNISASQWPWWRIIASTIAFSVWALAVPGNPLNFSDATVSGVISALAAMIVSTLLNLLTPFFEKVTPPAI
jgi:hypothetical protein